MKKNITINTKNSTIELNSKKFAIASSRYGTDEYKELQNARRDYPDFKVVVVARKNTKNNKPSFKGLTYEYMENYISKHDDEQNSIMEEYMILRGMTDEAEEACAETCSYQEMKEWFLDKFPAIAEFHKKREAILAKKVA